MHRFLRWILPLILAPAPLLAEPALPVLRSNTTTIDVQDGRHFRKAHWTAAPDLPLDVYYAERSRESKTITFRSDIDALSFEVAPGQTHDFIILLNGTVECRTRISTLRTPATFTGEGVPAIPFTMGSDNKIHIEGRINGSPPLDFMFDTGADIIVLFDSALARAPEIQFDGTTHNQGVGGTQIERTSNDNSLDIAGLHWGHERLMHMPGRVDDADGIIGYPIFEDKIVELDFDACLIRIHDAIPADLTGYSAVPMRFTGSLPEVEARLVMEGSSVTDWFLLDTGAKGGLQVSRGFATRHSLDGRMTRLGVSKSRGAGPEVMRNEVVQLPEFVIGGHSLREVPLHVATSTQAPFATSAWLGMDVLKRFNLLIDYQSHVVYIKPNSHFNEAFRRDYSRPGRTIGVAIGVGATLALTWILVKRRRMPVEPEHDAAD